MSSTSTFSNDLKELCVTNDWPAAKALFDRGHGEGKMPLDKGSISTRRLLVDLMLHCQVEVPTAYFYAGCQQPITYQILNYLKTAIRTQPEVSPELGKRARYALNVIVMGCTEMLPDSFRRAAELEVYAKAVQIGFPKDYLLDLMEDSAFKRAVLESDLAI